jgi:hypothetical protein
MKRKSKMIVCLVASGIVFWMFVLVNTYIIKSNLCFTPEEVSILTSDSVLFGVSVTLLHFITYLVHNNEMQ